MTTDQPEERARFIAERDSIRKAVEELRSASTPESTLIGTATDLNDFRFWMIGRLESGKPIDPSDVTRLFVEIDRLRAAVVKHHSQYADDLCWLDDNEMYAAFGLPHRDNSVGDREEMLINCHRFIAQRCEGGGPWKSYKELEEENATMRDELQKIWWQQDATLIRDVITQPPPD